jgi:hypothetical protein
MIGGPYRHGPKRARVESQVTERRNWGSVTFPSTRGLSCPCELRLEGLLLKPCRKGLLFGNRSWNKADLCFL